MNYTLLVTGNSAATNTMVTTTVTRAVGVAPLGPSAKVVNAVYGYIQAIRSLGRDTVSALEIAQALSLPEAEVAATIATLKDRGVKLVR